MGIQINGNNDIISALDGSWTAEGASINTSGILTATTFKGNVTGTACTFVDGNFTGNVTIGGTLTYEDVTNIDSVGLVTARDGVFIPDNKKLELGNAAGSGDLTIKHFAGGHSYITDTSNNIVIQTGVLRVVNAADNQNLATFSQGGASDLYFAGSQKITTASSGVNVVGTTTTGQLAVTGVTTFTGITTAGTSYVTDLKLPDGNTNGLYIGNSDDLHLFHNGASSYVENTIGDLTFTNKNNNNIIFKTTSSETERLRIKSDGKTFIHGGGATGANNTATILDNGNTLNIHGTSSSDGISLVRYSANYGAYGINIGKSRNNTFGTNTLVQDGNELGHISFYGADGTNFEMAAQITGLVDGDPATGGDGTDMPGALSFRTTAEGSDTPTEKLRIASDGRIVIGDDHFNNAFAGGDSLVIGNEDNGTRSGITLVSASNTDGGLYFSRGTSSSSNYVKGQIVYNHPNDYMAFYVDASIRALNIFDTGNVAIGNNTKLASYSSFRHLNVGSNLILNAGTSAGGYTGFHNNTFVNASGNWERMHNDHTSGIGMDDGNFYFRNAGAGTGTVSWQSVLTIEADGQINFLTGNGDTTNPDIGGSTSGVSINKNTTGQIYACTDAGGSAASNDTTSTVLNLCRRNGAGDGPQLALDRGGWIKASLAGLSGSNTASGGKGQFAIYTHDYSSGANVRSERLRIDAGGVQNYTGSSADNRYANVQIRHKTPYSTDGGYPGSQQTSTNQVVFSLYNESYGGNRMAFRSGQGNQFEIETKTRDMGSGSYNDADVYFRSQYDASLTDRYIIGAGGGHTFQSRSKVTLGVGSGGDIWFGENPYNSQWSATNAGGWYYREDQTSMIVASRANTGYATFYINKNTGAGGSQDTRWVDFYWNSNQYGRIEYNGASGTNYVTSSDYRLKENIVSITDGITEVKKLKPYRFNFKTDDDSKVVQGFFAHEAQEIVPYAVSGTKDEVVTQAQVDAGSQPEDKAVGDPIYQNVDYAKFTPILTAALQEAIAKIEVLEAKVAALEGS